MAGLITHHENKHQRILLIFCRLVKTTAELFASFSYGYCVFEISRTYFLAILSGIILFIIGQVIQLIGNKLSARQLFLSSSIFWLMKITAIIFESLIILTAHSLPTPGDGPIAHQLISNFQHLYYSDPSSVALVFSMLFGIDVLVAVLPERNEEWHLLLDDYYVVSRRDFERIRLPIKVEAAEVQIIYSIENLGLKAEIEDSSYQTITKLGFLQKQGIKIRNLSSGDYYLYLDNRDAFFCKRKIKIKVVYRMLQ